MNANELMIGDWVQGFIPDTYSRVVSIPFAYRLGITISGGHYIETAPDDLQPIPLTPEILEKNGFSDDYCNEDLCYAESYGGDIIGIHINGKNGCMDEMYFKFVHELQHALRLCGIKKEITLN